VANGSSEFSVKIPGFAVFSAMKVKKVLQNLRRTNKSGIKAFGKLGRVDIACRNIKTTLDIIVGKYACFFEKGKTIFDRFHDNLQGFRL